MKSAKSGDLVTASVVGAHLGMSRQRVGQLADEGVLLRDESGRFDLDAARVAYIRWMRAPQRRAVARQGQERIDEAKARRVELDLASRERELIPTGRAIAIIEDIATVYRSGYGALAKRVSGPDALRSRIAGEMASIERDVRAAVARGVRALHGQEQAE